MIALTLALRNLWKNRRRSLATLLAIGIGFAAVNLFAGYIANTYAGLRDSSIYGEGLGHLTIARNGYFANGSLQPERYILSPDDLTRLTRLLREDSRIEVISPRLSASGLVSNGKLSTIFIAEGEDPALANRIWQHNNARFRLDPRKPAGGLVSKALAERLGVGPHGNLVTMASTLEGQINALDLDVLQVWDTGNAATNDKTLRLPLGYLQQLLDTEGASRVVVLLTPGTDADTLRAALQPHLRAAGFDMEIKTWVELSSYYRQVKRLFDLIFAFLFTIVFIVVLMSIINTLSMSVMERVREIGTLRALGMQRLAVIRIFATEGALLGIAGSLAGAVLTCTLIALIHFGHVTYTPPASSTPVPLSIAFLPGMLGTTLVILAVIATLAACWPARRAARLEIVDALGHI